METAFEKLQAAWQTCDRQLKTQKRISEQLIRSMIRERSGSTLSSISRRNLVLAGLFLCYGIFFTVCITGNAFDYAAAIYFIPLVVQASACLAGSCILFHAYRTTRGVRLENESLVSGLRQMIAVNERHLKLNRQVWWFYFVPGVLFPFTFLPVMAEKKGMATALGIMAILVLIISLLVFLAKRAGFFESRQQQQLKANLQELEAHLAELESA